MQLPPDSIPTGLAGMRQRLALGPRVHPSAFIAPTATVVGDVSLGDESSVWYGAVLRGDINRIVIGPGTNIQDNVVIHLSDDFPVIVGELVTIGHGAIVHACTIEDAVLVGMGATILDGAEIGAHSMIGANALVPVGMKIPSGSLVYGSPARVVRQLSHEEQAQLKSWALKYVEVAKSFAGRPHESGPELS